MGIRHRRRAPFLAGVMLLSGTLALGGCTGESTDTPTTPVTGDELVAAIAEQFGDFEPIEREITEGDKVEVPAPSLMWANADRSPFEMTIRDRRGQELLRLGVGDMLPQSELMFVGIPATKLQDARYVVGEADIGSIYVMPVTECSEFEIGRAYGGPRVDLGSCLLFGGVATERTIIHEGLVTISQIHPGHKTVVLDEAGGGPAQESTFELADGPSILIVASEAAWEIKADLD